MIPKSKKTSYTELPSSLSAQLEQTLGEKPAAAIVEPVEASAAEIKEIPNEKVSSKKQDRNGQINICVPPEIKTSWKILFASCNVNMTQGITFAIEHLKQEIENGEVTLSIGGVIQKKRY